MEEKFMSSTTRSSSLILSRENLKPEQENAIARLYCYDETLLIAGVGFGKAVVLLTAMLDLIEDGHQDRMVLFAPLAVCRHTYPTEEAKWSHLTGKIAYALGNPAQRQAALDSDKPIVVCNFENVSWMTNAADCVFTGMAIDEITKLKSAGSTGNRKLRSWGKSMTWRAGVSATPVAECGEDVYAQAVVLDGGKALGTLQEAFLQTYFYKADRDGYDMRPKEGAAEAIGKRLRNLVWTADDTGYKASLPELEHHTLTVIPPADVMAMYTQMDQQMLCDVREDVTVVAGNRAVASGKLQQIAAGGLYQSEFGERDLVWTHDFKREVLRKLVASLGDEPVILVYTYAFEYDYLLEDYPGALVLGGGSKAPPGAVEQFGSKYKIAICHPKSMSHGLNLQAGRIIIHLSPCWSADAWAQCLGRIRRRGQERTCIRYVLCTAGTVDQEVMARHLMKADEEESFMNQFIKNPA
jgi:hypothetical protein